MKKRLVAEYENFMELLSLIWDCGGTRQSIQPGREDNLPGPTHINVKVFLGISRGIFLKLFFFFSIFPE